jgi:hypothetical protein
MVHRHKPGMRKIRKRKEKNSRDQGASVMEKPVEPNSEPSSAQAEAHIADAHKILTALQAKIGSHPEIGAAITKLEMALNVLAVKTGGLL